MRQIKFRGFNKKHNKWIYGYYLVNRGEHFICEDGIQPPNVTWEDFLVDPETVGQFTGLKDCRGKEIYDGDVITWISKRLDGVGVMKRGCVEWRERENSYIVVDSLRTKDGREFIHNLLCCTENVTVKGSIHENKELLNNE